MNTDILPTEDPAAHPSGTARERLLLLMVGNRPTEAVTRWFHDRARRRPLHVEVLAAIEDARASRTRRDALKALAEQGVESARERLVADSDSIEVSTRIVWDRPDDAVADAIGAASAIVIGVPDVEDWIAERVAFRVASEAVAPVVIVPDSWTARPGPVVVGVQPEEGLDDAAIDFAARESLADPAGLRIVSSWQLPILLAYDTYEPSIVDELTESAVNTVREATERARRTVGPDRLIRQTVVERDPVDALRSEAADARMLVVGTHGRSAVARVLLGSVSRQLLRNPPTVLAIVRQRATSDAPDADAG